jgi:2-keto-4-pentenoate hydratase/2-oxohepta-3-ene-1,7-dioic acid hydratase in catechol pathway
MKYVRYESDGAVGHGILDGSDILATDAAMTAQGKPTGETLPVSSVKLLAPVTPRTVVAIGLNYADHAKESGMEVPDEPFLFLKTPGTIISPGEEIKLVEPEHRNDYEAELVIVIGKEARGVAAADALDYILGYTCGNDVSDRNLQKSDDQWVRAKACDTYGPLGPVVTDEIDPHNVQVQTRLNGAVKQNSNTNQMIFKVPQVIEHVTKYIGLVPGDVIFTGTPPGIGPMQPGDSVEVEIEGIGTLQNPVGTV